MHSSLHLGPLSQVQQFHGIEAGMLTRNPFHFENHVFNSLHFLVIHQFVLAHDKIAVKKNKASNFKNVDLQTFLGYQCYCEGLEKREGPMENHKKERSRAGGGGIYFESCEAIRAS